MAKRADNTARVAPTQRQPITVPGTRNSPTCDGIAHIWSSFLEGWQPIDNAPVDEDVELLTAVGRGEPYRITYPCKRTAASGWVKRNVAAAPFGWRPFGGREEGDHRQGPRPPASQRNPNYQEISVRNREQS
jgi:hypothetical protein